MVRESEIVIKRESESHGIRESHGQRVSESESQDQTMTRLPNYSKPL